MNFIAHLYLPQEPPELQLGNFMGDFVANDFLEELPPTVRQGVFLHRAIDSFTDNHAQVLAGKRLLYQRHRKYAAVLIDIYFDFFLAEYWDHFSAEPLDRFIDRMYERLATQLDLMPSGLRQRLPRMIADDWLRSYTSLEGLERALYYLKKRVSRPELIEGAVDSLREQREDLGELFLLFFPDLKAFVEREVEGERA